MTALSKGAKYGAVWVTSFRNQWAYVRETVLNSLFLAIIMYIFVNLWSTTYQSEHQQTLSGYTVRDMVWYLAMTEAIMMGAPRLVTRLSREIKEGDIAYRLTRPLHYIGYCLFDFLGEACGKILINLCITGSVAACFYGLPPCTWDSLLLFAVVLCMAITLQFFMNMTVCLLLFWIEDGRGPELILTRLIMILGGMMIPLPLFPAWLARVCLWLPFQVVSYFPSATFVGKHLTDVPHELLTGAIWLGGFIVLALGLYRQGVKRLSVQGG